MVIDFYMHPVSPPCRAVIMTAQHLGIELNDIFLDVVAGETKKPTILKINPEGTVPTINDNGFYLWESRSIMAYFVNKYSPANAIYPDDPKQRAIVDRMLYFDIGTLFRTEFEILYPIGRKGVLLEDIEPEKFVEYKKAVILFEEFLKQTKYAAGDHLTIADFALAATITFAEFMDYNFDEYPRICEWLQRLKEEIPSFEDINITPIKKYKEHMKLKGK